MDSQIIVRTDTALRDGFKAYAENKGVTMSEVIRDFIDSKVKEQSG